LLQRVRFRDVRHFIDGGTIDPDKIMLPFSLEFFTDGLGTFFVGLVAVLSVSAIQWRPAFSNLKWNALLQARYVLLIIIAFAMFELTVKPCELTWLTFQYYEPNFSYQGYCVLHLLGIGFGWLGVACLASELFGKPGQFRDQNAGPLKAT